MTPIKPPKSFISSTFKSIGKVFATKPPSALPTPSVSTPAFEPEPPPVFDLAPATVPVPSPAPALKDSADEEKKDRPKRGPKPTISIKEQQEESKKRHDIITTTPPTEINLIPLDKAELKLWINTHKTTPGTDIFNKTSKGELLKSPFWALFFFFDCRIF